MKINGIKNISKIIYLLDKHIYNILKKEEMDEDRLETIVGIRNEYIQELNNQIRIKNTREMFNKKKN
jgi:hypothetical protein